MNRRLRVLVSAYACSPYRGSEPGVGWGFVSALGRHHDLWVIVEEEKFREDIERYLVTRPAGESNPRFLFLRKRRNRRLRKIWPPSYYWYYREWHREALRLAERLHGEVGFDLAHQLTMVGYREPGDLWKLGIPFVWGPVGGMGTLPWRFLPEIRWYGSLYYSGYNLFNATQQRLASRPRAAARAANSGLITATAENQRGAQRYWGVESTVVCEVGLPREPGSQIADRRDGEPLRLVWTGLHIPRKALNLALEALAKLPKELLWELHVLGDGPKRSSWQRRAVRLGIGERCLFHGWLERDSALGIMHRAHAMLITSLRDLTSTVTIEALALGLPIICLDHCGFADVVDQTCGVKVPVTTPKATIAHLGRAIESLAVDEPRRRELAEGALKRAAMFSWEEKVKVINRIYEAKVRGNRGEETR